MSIQKKFNPKNPDCKVTFNVVKDISKSGSRANLAGDFNNWDIESLPMTKQKNGDFSVSVNLKNGSEYQFRYLIDGNAWHNEKEADRFVPNGFQGTNSVVKV